MCYLCGYLCELLLLSLFITFYWILDKRTLRQRNRVQAKLTKKCISKSKIENFKISAHAKYFYSVFYLLSSDFLFNCNSIISREQRITLIVVKKVSESWKWKHSNPEWLWFFIQILLLCQIFFIILIYFLLFFNWKFMSSKFLYCSYRNMHFELFYIMSNE